MTYKPTCEFRWIKRVTGHGIGVDLKPVPLFSNVLQQKWVNGEEEDWRDIPVVPGYEKLVDMGS